MYSVLVLASRCSPVTHPTIAIPLIPNEARAKPFRIQFIPLQKPTVVVRPAQPLVRNCLRRNTLYSTQVYADPALFFPEPTNRQSRQPHCHPTLWVIIRRATRYRSRHPQNLDAACGVQSLGYRLWHRPRGRVRTVLAVCRRRGPTQGTGERRPNDPPKERLLLGGSRRHPIGNWERKLDVHCRTGPNPPKRPKNPSTSASSSSLVDGRHFSRRPQVVNGVIVVFDVVDIVGKFGC